MIRVVIVDDHPLVRRGLRDTLAGEADVEVVGEADRSEQVLGLVEREKCDVVVLDLSLPGRGGMEVLKDLQRDHPWVRVLIVSAHPESQYAVRAIRAGAAGYLEKTAAPEELVSAIRVSVRTGQYLSQGVARELAAYARDARDAPAHTLLSDRELEVLRQLGAGRTVSQVAAELSLSVKTVSTYRARLLSKLRLRTTGELIRYALQHSLTK